MNTSSIPDPAPARRPRRVCMVTHSYYESDNRVTRYAESLARRGDQVEVLCLRRTPEFSTTETMAGVRVHRLQDRFSKKERSKLDYLLPWLRFLWKVSSWLRTNHRAAPFDLIHVHNMPDFVTFAAWYPRWRGARILLDIHDIMPEFYGNKFRGRNNTLIIGLLKVLERLSAALAHHVIISNHLWLAPYAARTGTGDRSSVFINNVDARIFHPLPRHRQDGKLVVLFPGSLYWHQGIDLAIRAFVRVARELPQAELHLLGDGTMKPELVALAAELGLTRHVHFLESVRLNEVAHVMAQADLGVVPKRADSFGNEAYSTKIMEFMSVGVPVVISRTKIDQYYFNDSVVRFFDSGDIDQLATAIIELLGQPTERHALAARAAAYAAEHCWANRESEYFRLVDSLLAPTTRPTDQATKALNAQTI